MLDNSGAPAVAFIASDQATANTTATDIPGLSFAIGANEKWAFWCRFRQQKSTGTAGIKYAVNGPSGMTVEAEAEGNTTGPTAITVGRISALATLTSTIYGTVATTDGWVTISGTVTAGATPGTVSIQQASVTSGNATAFASGRLVAWRGV